MNPDDDFYYYEEEDVLDILMERLEHDLGVESSFEYDDDLDYEKYKGIDWDRR